MPLLVIFVLVLKPFWVAYVAITHHVEGICTHIWTPYGDLDQAGIITVIGLLLSLHKHPGGWETALAVKHFLKTNSSGAVTPCAFYDEHYLNFSRGKFDDFEGMSWYLQGFVVLAGWSLFPCSLGVLLLQAFAQSVAGETEKVCALSMVPSLLPNPNSLKQLRVHSTIFACAPRRWHCTFGQLPHTIDATGVQKQCTSQRIVNLRHVIFTSKGCNRV